MAHFGEGWEVLEGADGDEDVEEEHCAHAVQEHFV